MAQKAGMSWSSIILVALGVLGFTNPLLAQTTPKERIVGDWELSEDRYGSKPTGVPDTAITWALGGRTAQLWASCFTYEVQFYLNWDAAFSGSFPEGASENTASIKIDRDHFFRTVVLTPHVDAGATFVTPFINELLRGSTLMICPKDDDKNSACLSFSLRGFTAALKAICPKR